MTPTRAWRQIEGMHDGRSAVCLLLAVGCSPVDVQVEEREAPLGAPAALIDVDANRWRGEQTFFADARLRLSRWRNLFPQNLRPLHGITTCCPNEYVEIDPSTGAITHVSDIGDAQTGFTGALALDRVGQRFFLSVSVRTSTTSVPHLRTVDVATGAYSDLPVSERIVGLGFDDDSGTLFGITQYPSSTFNFVQVDPNSGAMTHVGSVPIGNGFHQSGVTFDGKHDRMFYVFITHGDPVLGTVDYHVGIIDTATGATSDVPLAVGLGVLTWDPIGEALLGVTNLHGSPPINAFEVIDPATGAATELNNIGGPTFGFPSSRALDAGRHRYYFPRSSMSAAYPDLLAIDTQTGAIVSDVPLTRLLISLISE